MEPTLSQVIEVVRNSSGEHRKPIDSNTLIEADLHICGIDGVQLATEEDGYRKTFSLAENEYLFTGEGIDFFGICRFIRWIRGIPEPVICDLTVGKLHAALVKAVKEQVKRD